MTHLASADCDPEFTRAPDRALPRRHRGYAHLTRHAANSAGALRFPGARFDAARCGIALYGLSPFGEDPADDGLEPVLRWRKPSRAGAAARGRGEHRLRAALRRERETWIGIVPVGYADGFRRDLTGTEVRVARRAAAGRRHGLDGRVRRRARPASCRSGTPVVLVGHGVLLEEHARVAGRSRTSSPAGSIRAGPRAADGARCVSWRARCSPGRRRGSSAAPSGTSCSAGRWSTWTSRAAIRGRPRGRSRGAPAGRRFRSPSGTAPGGSHLTRGERSTSLRSGTGSRRISRPGTSP